MGYALKFPGKIVNPAAKTALTEPFGVAGVAYRYEADSYTAAVGTLIPTTDGWLNKITAAKTTANAGTTGPLVGPLLGVDSRATKYPTVDYATGAANDQGIDGLVSTVHTVVALIGYKGLSTARVFELGGRRLNVYPGGYELASADGTATPKVQLAGVALRPATDRLTALIVTLSADGSADTITVRTLGATSTAAGSSAKSGGANRLRIGAGSHTTGDGPLIAALGIWTRALSATEIANVLIPALQTRYGIA
jgi:hypothetical protein